SAKKAFPYGRKRGTVTKPDGTTADLNVAQWGHLALILPYAEEGTIYGKIDFTKAPEDTVNVDVKKQKIAMFYCPIDLGKEDRMNITGGTCPQADNRWLDAGRTNYFGNGGSDTGQTRNVGPTPTPPPLESAADLEAQYKEQNNGIFVTNRA